MSKSCCHYNQPRQRWKRVSREDDVRLSRFGILRSHTFSPSFLPVSCSPRARPPAASPRANRAVLSASAVSKCQSNRERSRPRPSSCQPRIHHERVKGDVLLHVLTQDLRLRPDTLSRLYGREESTTGGATSALNFNSPAGFISFLARAPD